MQELIIKIYKNELKHEEKYDKQFEKLMDKYEDILYGKIARIYKGREITNKDLYGPDNLLLKFSDAIESVLDNQKPKVVLASLAGLETSSSQVLFKRWCEKEENLLLFVTSPPPGTLADSILNSHSQKQFSFTV